MKILTRGSAVEAERETMKARINAWKVFGIVVFVAAVAGIFYLWYQGNLLFEGGLSLDGVITLLGGALAFIAVMAQIREQSKESKDERERQRKALATGILHEADNFYRYYLRDVRRTLSSGHGDRSFVRSIEHFRFLIYEENAHRIGDLPAAVVSDTIGFYSAATVYLSNFREIRFAVLRAGEEQESQERAKWEGRAEQHRTSVKNNIPPLIWMNRDLTKKLCELVGAQFDSFAVAKEDEKSLERECQNIQNSYAQAH